MAQRDREQPLTRAEKLAGVEQQPTGLATWDECDYWMAPNEITGGVNGFFLRDPRPLDQPDVPLAQYAAEMDRRLQEDPDPDWEAAEGAVPNPEFCGWKDSYRVSCEMRRYVRPAPAPKPQKVESVAPEQVALDDEIQF
jgi:hypothetical protein